MAERNHPKIASLRVVVDGIPLFPGAFNRRSAVGCAALASPRMQSLIGGWHADHNLTVEKRDLGCERILEILVRRAYAA